MERSDGQTGESSGRTVKQRTVARSEQPIVDSRAPHGKSVRKPWAHGFWFD
jgi:hypothetical protein